MFGKFNVSVRSHIRNLGVWRGCVRVWVMSVGGYWGGLVRLLDSLEGGIYILCI